MTQEQIQTIPALKSSYIPLWVWMAVAAGFSVCMIFYSMLIFQWGVSYGLKQSQRSFYIQHYHSAEPFLQQGLNSTEDPTKAADEAFGGTTKSKKTRK